MTLYISNTPFVTVDLTTKEVVKDLLSKCDGRAACSEAELSETICAVLAMRGLGAFKFHKADKTKGQKAAIDQILRHLMPDLIVGTKGKDLYQVTTNTRKLNPTKVRPDTPNVFPFRVTGEYANYGSVVGIPCAEAVSLISGNRACKLVMPDVATTFAYLLREKDLPARIGKLDPLEDMEGAKDFTKEYRQVIHRELTRSGYMGLLVPDDSDTALTFVVCSQWAKDFPTFLEQITRPWFREYKFDLVKLYCEISDNLGKATTITGQPTMQLLRESAGMHKVA